MDALQSSAAIEVSGLTKSFGTVRANDRIDLRVSRGSIHGIVGENGAGKSTLMKLLYGIYQPDAGEILLDGRPRRWTSPRDALAAGLGMVHQHFMLAGPFTALDNVILGEEPMSGAVIDRRTALARLEALSAQYGLQVDWSERIENLPVGIQQRLEILKLLYRQASVLMLDEPTAVLTPQEVAELFGRLRE